tara:strand:- start:50 stop:277 length:228 start_codon:yes stop_codon:yes gene_type:complete
MSEVEGYTKDQIEANIEHFIDYVEDKGNLVCGCGSNPSSEPIYDSGNDVYSAMCPGCKDWSDFIYEQDMEDQTCK